MRLTRTETNMAYRTADHLRWKQMDFVVGIEIRTSNHHPAPDICDDLKGKYPKDFKFVGWHPQCRCHAVPILSDLDEMIEWGKQVLAGEADIDSYHPEQITELPSGFRNWVMKNEERIKGASSMPYFLRDNRAYLPDAISSKIKESLEQPIIRDIQEKLAKAQSASTQKAFVAFEPFSAYILQRLAALQDFKQKQQLLKEILEDERAATIIETEKGVKTRMFPGNKGPSTDSWKATKDMARALNEAGIPVTFLPEEINGKSADALTYFGRRIVVADFKHCSTTNWNTLRKDIEDGFSKADAVVVKLERMDLGQFREAIDYLRRNNKPIKDVIVLNEYGKKTELPYKLLRSGLYIKKLRGKL